MSFRTCTCGYRFSMGEMKIDVICPKCGQFVKYRQGEVNLTEEQKVFCVPNEFKFFEY